MTDEEALLAAVIAAPDDDLPRLVYADWIEERGDPERATFIRSQIAAGTSERPTPPTEPASRWVKSLTTGYGVRCDQVAFHRGFVHTLRGTPSELTTVKKEVFQSEPVRRLEVVPGEENVVKALHQRHEVRIVVPSPSFLDIAGWPELARLTSLRVLGHYAGDEGASALATSRFVSSLTELGLARNMLGDDGVAALAESPHLAGLRHLDLFDNPFDIDGALALAESPYLNHLETLNLGCTLDESSDDYQAAVTALTRRFGSAVFVTGRD